MYKSAKAVKALILAQGKYLLLVKSLNENNLIAPWDFPGGQVKDGEALIEALVREVKEETCIDVDVANARPVKRWVFEKDGVHTDGTDFFCVLSECPETKLSFEHNKFYWFTENEIMANETIPSWLKDTVRLSRSTNSV